MSFADRVRRVPVWVWVLVFAGLMLLPGLGSFGFWDPWELNVADRVREIARSGNLTDPTAGGRRKYADLAVAALGLVLGLLAGGALLGVVLPCLALTGALLAGWGLSVRAAESEPAAALTSSGAGPDVPAGGTLGAALRSS